MNNSSIEILSEGQGNEWNALTETELSFINGGIAPGYVCGKGYSEETKNGNTTIKCACNYGPSTGMCGNNNTYKPSTLG